LPLSSIAILVVLLHLCEMFIGVELCLLVVVKYPGYHGLSITAQNSGYDQFPPSATGWRTTHPIPDKAPPLQVEVEGPPT
jgi:hypothetical protein